MNALWLAARAPAGHLAAVHNHVTTAKLLSPFLAGYQQCRNASILSSLSDNKSSYNKRIRRGRGPASGKGKTSGRGNKGQKQHGKVPQGFNGGQTPDVVVSGVRGFENKNAVDLNQLNISKLAKWIAMGRIDPRQPITIPVLVSSGCVAHRREGVKLLAKRDPSYELKTPIQIIVNRASVEAIAAVEAAGGQVVTRYYSPASVKRIMQKEVHPYYSLQSKLLPGLTEPGAGEDPANVLAREGEDAQSGSQHNSLATIAEAADAEQIKRNEMARYKYRLADATSRKDIEYYRDDARRGYLSYTVGEGQNPSLFFSGSTTRKPKAGNNEKKKKKSGILVAKRTQNAAAANRLWT